MATAKSVISYAKEALLDELYATAIYSKLAEHYEGRDLSRKFRELAEMEKNHAKFWSEFLGRREVSTKGVKVSRLKVSFWVLLFRILGLGLTFKILESSERKAIEMYSEILNSEELSSEEREALKKVLEDELIHEHTFAEEESRFKEFINHVRDAVLGMNDGLVEVLSVSAGLAGAYGDLPLRSAGRTDRRGRRRPIHGYWSIHQRESSEAGQAGRAHKAQGSR